MTASIPVVVSEIRELNSNVVRIRLAARTPSGLPRFAAGAHVDVQVPNGLLRSYSLCSDPETRGYYDIAVGLSKESRGGSAYLFDELVEGDVILIHPPVEAFGLQSDCREHVFVAGGIGITPFVAMAHALRRRDVPFTLHYAVRSGDDLPEDLLSVFDGRLHLYPADRGDRLDLKRLLAGSEARADAYYFCGPPRLLSEARHLTAAWPTGRARFESFAAAPVGKVSAGQPFVATIRSTGTTLAVTSGETLLERLRGAGFDIGSSCEHGTCGTCRIRYVGGQAVHRDAILDDAERAHWLTPCISRGVGELLLDL